MYHAHHLLIQRDIDIHFAQVGAHSVWIAEYDITTQLVGAVCYTGYGQVVRTDALQRPRLIQVKIPCYENQQDTDDDECFLHCSGLLQHAARYELLHDLIGTGVDTLYAGVCP